MGGSALACGPLEPVVSQPASQTAAQATASARERTFNDVAFDTVGMVLSLALGIRAPIQTRRMKN